MQITDDGSLLRQYTENLSEEAFAALVTRHINLVYSVALRQVGNPHHAEEITQAVFIILARKAAQLRHDKALSSWLFQATRLTAGNFVRSEMRRQRREQEAHMQSLLNDPETEIWPRIAPLLDAAVGSLNEKDRRAVVLRFYEGKSFREIALVLGASEDAAEKRLKRAVEKMQRFFSRRGVVSTAVILAGAISANSVQAAPAALIKPVTALAFANGAAAGGSTLTLIQGALKVMAWSKVKMAVMVGAGMLLATGTTVSYWELHHGKAFLARRFDAVYQLRPGEVARLVGPPYDSARAEFYHTDPGMHEQSLAITKPPNVFIFKQDAQGSPHFAMCMFGDGKNPLQRALEQTMGFRRYEFEDPGNLLKLNILGDWTIREGVSREAFLAAAESYIFKATKRHIHFEKRTIEREVIVASGGLKFVPAVGDQLNNEKTIRVYAEKANGRPSDSGYSLENLLGTLGEHLDTFVINETEKPEGFAWEYFPDADSARMGKRRAELTDKVLANLSKQTGLFFAREQRSVDIWLVSEQR